MNKAEEAKKEISQLRIKRQNAIDDARITYLEGFIAGSEYAQQVSRDVAIDFVNHLKSDEMTGDLTEEYSKVFDEWIKNQHG